MVKDLNVALLHLDAAVEALRELQVELCRWAEVAHPDDERTISAAQCIAEQAETELDDMRSSVADLVGIIEELEEE